MLDYCYWLRFWTAEYWSAECWSADAMLDGGISIYIHQEDGYIQGIGETRREYIVHGIAIE